MTRILITLAFILLIATPSPAQEWLPKQWQSGYDRLAEKRARRLARERHERERSERCRWYGVDCRTVVYAYRKYDRDGDRSQPQCHREVTARGGAANTETGALNQAKRAWRAQVRSDYGEIYLDLANAEDTYYRCWRASTNESVLGQAAERVGSIFSTETYQKRCIIYAKPCLGEVKKLEIDKGGEDRD